MLLDASALLAFLLKEEGGLEVLKVVSSQPCWISSVTLTEVQGKLVGRGAFTPARSRPSWGRCWVLSAKCLSRVPAGKRRRFITPASRLMV